MNPKPTSGELDILTVLWREGPTTVKQVWEALGQKTGYTSVLKLMQLMNDKGLVERDTSSRSHIYSAVTVQEEAESELVANLRDQAFGGSASRLVLRALADEPIPADELKEIRRLIEQMEKKK